MAKRLPGQEPLGPPPINLIPRGLLNWLGIKSGGRNPTHLTEDLLANIDLTDLYSAGNRWISREDTVTVNAVGPAVGSTGALMCPVTELWLLYHASVRTDVLAAGEAVTFQAPVIFRQQLAAQTSQWDTTGPAIQVAATQLGGQGKSYPRPLVLVAGDQIGLSVQAVTVQADMIISACTCRIIL